MVVGIAGLGLIGGSMAKAYKKAEHTVFAYDIDASIIGFAKLSGAIDGTLNTDVAVKCDLILIALPPRAALEYIESISPSLGSNNIVIDCCGVKQYICEQAFQLAETYGFTFIGGHPMAGTHNAGFKYSNADLFKDAAMVIVPPRYDDIELFDKIGEVLKPAGFGRLTVTTAEKHDKMIAFTSQLAHVVSNAFIKSPTAQEHTGFSAGSYKDLTRVAKLNPEMWSELFIENRDALLYELDVFISSVTEYRDALASSDTNTMCKLLDEGRALKEKVDGR